MGKNLTIETIFLFFYQSYKKILNAGAALPLFLLVFAKSRIDWSVWGEMHQELRKMHHCLLK